MPHNQVMNQNVVVTYSDNIMNNINSGVGVLNNSGNSNNDNLFIRPLPINDYQQQNNTAIPQVKFGKIFVT